MDSTHVGVVILTPRGPCVPTPKSNTPYGVFLLWNEIWRVVSSPAFSYNFQFCGSADKISISAQAQAQKPQIKPPTFNANVFAFLAARTRWLTLYHPRSEYLVPWKKWHPHCSNTSKTPHQTTNIQTKRNMMSFGSWWIIHCRSMPAQSLQRPKRRPSSCVNV